MSLAVLLALAASLCTATSSVCQRLGAVSIAKTEGTGFDPLLVFRLARRPVWLLGFAGMLAGFACQLTALRFGPLALVQPVLAVELPVVFGLLAVLRPGQVRRRDWLAAAAMAAGVALFLAAAAPSGGTTQATRLAWVAAAAVAVAAVLTAVVAATAKRSRAWRAAWLGIATGTAWGFVAALVKELSVAPSLAAVFTTWPVYALMGAGAAAMLLTAHAMSAGPLAVSQPGFTILDPLTATLLGAVLYREGLRNTPLALAAEIAAVVILAAGVRALSRSPLVTESE